MCGITGIFGNGVSRQDLEKMLGVVKARGPEDCSTKDVKNGILGHARLAFVDVKNNTQPYVDKETGTVIAFNGEIYGWKAISEKYGLGANNDTEVLARGLHKIGPKILEELTDSQFAYIAQVPRNGGIETVVGRDAYGISPLVFGRTANGEVAIASTPNALEAIGVSEIKTVPAGTYGQLDGDSIKLARWFDFPVVASKDQTSIDPKMVRERAIRSVESEIPDEKSVLYTAMGGMDSQFITIAVARATKGNFGGAITVVPYDSANPNNMDGGDVAAARETVKMLKNEGISIKHHVVQLTPEYARQNLDKILDVLGPDYFNAACGLAEHLVATTARKYGGKAVMTAGGPDETGMYKSGAYLNAKKVKFNGGTDEEVNAALERGARSVQEQFPYSEGTRAGLVLGLEGVENRVPLKFLINLARSVKSDQRYEITGWGDGKNPLTMDLKDKLFWRQAAKGYVPDYTLNVKKETVHGATGAKPAIYEVAKSDSAWQSVRQSFCSEAKKLGYWSLVYGDLSNLDPKNPITEGQAYVLYRWAKNHPVQFAKGGNRYADKSGERVYHRDLEFQVNMPICYDWQPAGDDI